MEDKRIIQGCLANDRKYQKMLLDKYSASLMATALRYHCDRHSAKDMIQEAWIKIFSSIESYEEAGMLQAWIKRILINTILKSREKKTIKIADVQIWNNEINALSWDNDQLEMEDLMNMIKTISPPAREIFMMHVIDGFSHSEIGEMMNISPSTSRVHLSNARK